MDKTGVLYDQIGTGYNTTRRADAYITERLFELLSPKKEQLYLDIGCGTGNYTIALANMGIDLYGVEPSMEMLDIARSKNGKVNWLTGAAELIPGGNDTFSGAIATLTIHHWADIRMALTEVGRVLKQNADFVLFTALPQQMKGYWLNHYFPKMMIDAITQMPTYETIEGATSETGFTITQTEKYFIRPDLQDNFLYAGKHDPKLYLNKEVRKGISSFAALANMDEVHNGLNRLAHDMATNRFPDIKQQYDNDIGDYILSN